MIPGVVASQGKLSPNIALRQRTASAVLSSIVAPQAVLPTNPAPGSTLLLFVRTQTLTTTPLTPSGWTFLGNGMADGDTYVQWTLFGRKAVGNEQTSPVVHYNSTAHNSKCEYQEWEGLADLPNLIDHGLLQAAQTSGSTTGFTPATKTASQAKMAFIVFVAVGSSYGTITSNWPNTDGKHHETWYTLGYKIFNAGGTLDTEIKWTNKINVAGAVLPLRGQ